MTTPKKSEKQVGRPVKYPMPEPIPDTPENVMRAIIATPRDKKWRYLQSKPR